jgi:hypothetical protein
MLDAIENSFVSLIKLQEILKEKWLKLLQDNSILNKTILICVYCIKCNKLNFLYTYRYLSAFLTKH